MSKHKRQSKSGQPKKKSCDVSGVASHAFSAHSISGIDVNPATALSATAVLACFQMLCEDFAKLTPVLYRKDKDGGRIPAVDHELYDLLYRPNSYQNYFEWAEMKQFWLLARGNAYSVKIRNARGKIIALIPVSSDWVAMWEAPDGALFYRVTPNGLHMRAMLADEPFLIPAEDMLHIKGFSMNGLLGASRLVLAKEAIGLSLAYERQAAQWMGQGASVNGVLTTDKSLTPEAAKRMAQDWRDTKSGLQNAGKVLVLEQGLKWQNTAMTAVDAEFLASRGFGVTEIARVWRVPAHMIGDLSKSTNNNITQQAQEYINLTLSSYTQRWGWKLDVDFGLRAQGIFLEYDLSILTRADVTQRYANYARGIAGGFLTPNEARVDDGKNPVAGGDKLLQPSNLAAAGSQSTGGAADGGGRPEDGSAEQKL
jgi:HK97 family phage portal protein